MGDQKRVLWIGAIAAVLLFLGSVFLIVPGILKSRINRNEVNVIVRLRELVIGQSRFQKERPPLVFGTLSELSILGPEFLPPDIVDGIDLGYCYTFVLGVPPDSNYEIRAIPLTRGETGNRWFFTNSGGVIRAGETGEPSSVDSPID